MLFTQLVFVTSLLTPDLEQIIKIANFNKYALHNYSQLLHRLSCMQKCHKMGNPQKQCKPLTALIRSEQTEAQELQLMKIKMAHPHTGEADYFAKQKHPR